MLNDYSGSPKILASVIKGLVNNGFKVDLYTSRVDGGCLSALRGVTYHRIFYKFSQIRLFTFIGFLLAQIRYLFVALGFKNEKNVIFYINTIMPFGAALGAGLSGKKIIYHVHENPVRKNFIHRIAQLVLTRYAGKVVFVSKYLFNTYDIDENRKKLVYNSLDPEFSAIAGNHEPLYRKPFTILMICSLKKYKGIDIFYQLACEMPEYRFVLVLNAVESEINAYFAGRSIPGNMRLFTGTADLHKFYVSASLVVNLTIPGLCRESFGMTVLEALAYGIPVIVPSAGGIKEMVEDGINGYKVDPLDRKQLVSRIHGLFSDEGKYYQLSLNARKTAGEYSYQKMIQSISDIITDEI
ncbi:MAG TPA: glycosyltransferase family 4 protein [Bacteroidales bacterium]|jgi:glycosyltransferase involved in cell wall biosynthesis|nr:glycosyltransferase family 4 protein [Bacteroidales bacterium]